MTLTDFCKTIQLKPGDGIGLASSDLLGASIRHATAGPGEGSRLRVANHIENVSSVINKTGVHLIGAVPPAVRVTEASGIRDEVVFVWRPSIPSVGDYVAYLCSQIGIRYDYPAFWRLITGIGKQDPKRPYCSELRALALQAGGYEIDPSWSIYSTPWQMQVWAEAKNEIIYRSYKPWW